jgi:hypothetical protein
MDKLIIKLFGVNRLNLVGWVCVGVLVIFGSVALGVAALVAYADGDPGASVALLLGSVALLLLGVFGVLLQIYCSLLAEKLERQQSPAALPGPDGRAAPGPYGRADARYREMES